MQTLLEYMYDEANKAGSKFEQTIAANISKWLKQTGLSKRFSARRYLTVSEDDGSRDEDYSDIEVTDLKTGNVFFIECKNATKSNIITTMFNIGNTNYKPYPVETAKRIKSDDEYKKKLASDIYATEEYLHFVRFLKSQSLKKYGNYLISDILFNRIQLSLHQFFNVVNDYNKLVDSGYVESDCKKFDTDKNFRLSTHNTLVVGLLWRLYDKINNTWDICHVNDISYFGKMIKNHYTNEKAVKASYILLGSELYMFDLNDNPFNINCAAFPEDAIGNYDMKFTPRFGVNGMYITPRSKVTSKLPKSCSFADETKFPKVNNNI